MEGWGLRQEESFLLTPCPPHLWPQEMPFKNLHRRRRVLTPKTKGTPSLSNTDNHLCMHALSHTQTYSQPCTHAYATTSTTCQKASNHFFFFTKHHNIIHGHGRISNQDFASSVSLVNRPR